MPQILYILLPLIGISFIVLISLVAKSLNKQLNNEISIIDKQKEYECDKGKS